MATGHVATGHKGAYPKKSLPSQSNPITQNWSSAAISIPLFPNGERSCHLLPLLAPDKLEEMLCRMLGTLPKNLQQDGTGTAPGECMEVG